MQALVTTRLPFVIASALILLTASSAGASGWRAASAGGATAQAYGIKVIAPGGGGATPTVSAPPDAVQFSGGFSYGKDANGNPLVSTGSANASVSAVAGRNASATASAEVSSLSAFNGEITATSVVAHASATAKPGSATGSTSGTEVSGLVALGQSVAPGGSATLADWGSLHTLETGSSGSTASGYHGFVTAVDIHLTADHAGLPAGTSILVGYAEVAAEAAPAQPASPPAKRSKAGKAPAAKGNAPEPKPGFLPIRQPPKITPPLKTPGGHVFPVYGPSSFADTFGAFRGDVSGGWHHGDDIFAPLGAPLLACASGTVFSVGWNEVGGNRLWLRDGAGNLYYYAHLSAFSPMAVNGNQVNAGDVVGFVGNTGDAQGTPYHLHFEIHPVGLLGMGYDGAVDPTTYLEAWKHLQDVSFEGGDAWAPHGTLGTAPKSGAYLISATDISSADGLDPGSLQRALRPLGGADLPAAPAATRVPAKPRQPADGQPTAAGLSP
jgi:murein DD-endopeptidase MepM/ murein hydrolase activator NlpD